MEICISKDFSATPGSRYINEGKYSGEEFRETLLKPKFIEAKNNKEKLIIYLDGGYGYPTSFLEEAFGGLARMYNPKEIISTLSFVSEDEPSIIDEIKNYILNAGKE